MPKYPPKGAVLRIVGNNGVAFGTKQYGTNDLELMALHGSDVYVVQSEVDKESMAVSIFDTKGKFITRAALNMKIPFAASDRRFEQEHAETAENTTPASATSATSCSNNPTLESQIVAVLMDRGESLLNDSGVDEKVAQEIAAEIIDLYPTPIDPAISPRDFSQAKPLQRAILQVQRLVAELSPLTAPWVGSAICHLGKIRGWLEILNLDNGKDYDAAALKK